MKIKRKTARKLSPSKSSKRNPIDRTWRLYEHMKAAVPSDLSPEEYERACQRIAIELGI